MRHSTLLFAISLPLAILAGSLVGCDTVPDPDDPLHPVDRHDLFPDVGELSQRASGPPTGEVLPQPVAFTHHRHVTVLEIGCQYCHVDARKSIHSSVPPLGACMGCHKSVKTESPEIQKLHQAWCGEDKCSPMDTGENAVPIPWNKVYDLPDYVYFSHKRHVRAGVDCLECHPGVDTMGQWPDGDASRAEVMVRVSTLQMGWCLDCHESHETINENYGELSDLRRAELKDCWTCHK